MVVTVSRCHAGRKCGLLCRPTSRFAAEMVANYSDVPTFPGVDPRPREEAMLGAAGSKVVPTHLDGIRRTGYRLIGCLRVPVELRRTAVDCVGAGQDYESVALPLSYPGAKS